MIRYLGYVAGFLTVSSFLPQVIRAFRTRQTRDLSLTMFTLLITSGTLWMIYGFIQRDWPIVLTNIGMVSLNGALAFLKIRYTERTPQEVPEASAP